MPALDQATAVFACMHNAWTKSWYGSCLSLFRTVGSAPTQSKRNPRTIYTSSSVSYKIRLEVCDTLVRSRASDLQAVLNVFSPRSKVRCGAMRCGSHASVPVCRTLGASCGACGRVEYHLRLSGASPVRSGWRLWLFPCAPKAHHRRRGNALQCSVRCSSLCLERFAETWCRDVRY